jgi:hypothetical protein
MMNLYDILKMSCFCMGQGCFPVAGNNLPDCLYTPCCIDICCHETISRFRLIVRYNLNSIKIREDASSELLISGEY